MSPFYQSEKINIDKATHKLYKMWLSLTWPSYTIKLYNSIWVNIICKQRWVKSCTVSPVIDLLFISIWLKWMTESIHKGVTHKHNSHLCNDKLYVWVQWVSSNLSWFASLNNKAFGNLFCNPEKSFHTSPRSSDSNNRGYRPFFKLNNSICIYKKS